MLRNLDFTFDPEKDHYEPRKTVNVSNNNAYIRYESIGERQNTNN